MDTSLAYATTPLALASLAIIIGVGILKLIVTGKNNALNRLITHYGFVVVIIFGVLGNLAYFYGMYQTSEVLIFGNVTGKDGSPLSKVVVNTGGHARGMSSDTGDFILAIPSSRQSESYEITATLSGYEKVKKVVKHSSHMSVNFELESKKFKISDVVKFSDGEITIGHYMGLPEVYVPISVENMNTSQMIVRNFSLLLISPSGKQRQLLLANSALAMNVPAGPALPQVQVKMGDKFSWVNGFIQYDNRIQQTSIGIIRMLQSDEYFRNSGPHVERQILPENMTEDAHQAMNQNWFWEVGKTKIQLGFSANDTKYEIENYIFLSQEQVEAMRKISDYYRMGYGLLSGYELIPVGSAQPGQKIRLEIK